MAKTGEVKSAAAAAEALLKGKIGLIEALSAAREAEKPIKDSLAKVKQAAEQVPDGGGRGELLKAAALIEDALQAARQHVKTRKSEALAGGWTSAELAQLGLVSTRAKRSPAPASEPPADAAPPVAAAPPDPAESAN
jgi:hypothetical protein